jgi:hypothetical protein
VPRILARGCHAAPDAGDHACPRSPTPAPNVISSWPGCTQPDRAKLPGSRREQHPGGEDHSDLREYAGGRRVSGSRHSWQNVPDTWATISAFDQALNLVEPSACRRVQCRLNCRRDFLHRDPAKRSVAAGNRSHSAVSIDFFSAWHATCTALSRLIFTTFDGESESPAVAPA